MYSLHHCNIYVNIIIWLMFNGKNNSDQDFDSGIKCNFLFGSKISIQRSNESIREVKPAFASFIIIISLKKQ